MDSIILAMVTDKREWVLAKDEGEPRSYSFVEMRMLFPTWGGGGVDNYRDDGDTNNTIKSRSSGTRVASIGYRYTHHAGRDTLRLNQTKIWMKYSLKEDLFYLRLSHRRSFSVSVMISISSGLDRRWSPPSIRCNFLS